MRISRDHAILPITAAAAVEVGSDTVLLVGEGPSVKLFSLTCSFLLGVIPVFQTQAIHGISCSATAGLNVLCVIWGGRSLLFVRLQFQQALDSFCLGNTTIYQEIRLEDWVLDAKFLPDNEKRASRAIFLDAHNKLFSLSCSQSLNDSNQDEPILLASGPPSALYCGNIQFDTSGEVLVASGTVFGGVHLWSTKPADEAAQTGRLIAMYAGHEGSVFGICLSRLSTREGLQWVIVTCSDDRTIKLWKFSNEVEVSYSGIYDHDLETGFAEVGRENPFDAHIASNTGHLSRIWRVAAKSVVELGSIVVTFGEDATFQLWQLQGNAEFQNLTLNKGRMTSLHTGKSIWTGLMTEKNACNQIQIVTGGADGRLTVSSLGMLQQQTIWSTGLPNTDDSSSGRMPRSYCWLDCSRILMVDVAGYVSLGAVSLEHQKPIIQWTIITRLSELSGHALSYCIGSDHVLIAGSSGEIYLFSTREMRVQLLLKMNSRIKFLFGAYSGERTQHCCINFAVVCIGSSTLYTGVVSSNTDTSNTTQDPLEKLDLPAGFMVTAAQYLGSDVLALGSRNGDVALCQVNQEFSVQRLDLLRRVHERETVTSIQSLEAHECILTTGRDGQFRIHRIQYHTTGIYATCIHSGKLLFGPDIEGAKLISNELYIWGFKGSDFILWNHNLQQELATIDCGGKHRSWSFCHGSVPMIAWSRLSTLCIAPLHSASTILQQGSHGREIKAIAMRPINDITDQILATGAEDTCIRLSRYIQNTKTYQTLHTIPTHTTGIQKLAWSSDGTLLFSAAGKEEFFVWQIHSVPILVLGVTLLMRCPTVTPTEILRITDFDVVENTTEDGTRYTILMVYSDSTLRIWSFDSLQASFELLTEAIYATCCIIQCKILGDYLLTASTDGYLVLWRRNDLSRVARRCVHQSSIKCLDIKEWDGQLLVVTGGDDGALAFCLLDLSDPITKWQRTVIPKAHASAVNALSLLPGTGSKAGVITASNDQRVKIWDISIEPGAHSHEIIIKRVGNYASSIADASCMQTFIQDHVHNTVIAGVGLEFWKEDIKS